MYSIFNQAAAVAAMLSRMARRRAQMLKAYGKSPVVRFYGQLSHGE